MKNWDPVEVFTETLCQGINEGKWYLAPHDVASVLPVGAERIGWLDDVYLYLLPNECVRNYPGFYIGKQKFYICCALKAGC